MGKNLTGKQRSTIVLKAMQHYDFKRRRMMDGCMKPFLTRLISEMKISIDERTVRRLLETMKEQEDSGAEVFDFDPKSVGNAGRKSKLTVELKGKYLMVLKEYAWTFRSLKQLRLKKILQRDHGTWRRTFWREIG